MSTQPAPEAERITFPSVAASPSRVTASRRSPQTWILTTALFVGFALAVYFVLRGAAEAGQGMPPYSVYSNDRNGLAQTAQFLAKLGFEPVAVTRPIHQTHHRGLLILVEPSPGPAFPMPTPDVSSAARNGILNWVANGNTLLLVSPRETSLHRAFQVSVRSAEREGDEETNQAIDKVELTGYTADLDRLEVESRAALEPKIAHVPLWWQGERPGAVLVKHGQGRVLIVSDSSLLTHRGLLRSDNVMFLYNVAVLEAVDGRVYFDEYHHGIRAGGGYWGYLRYHGQHWVLLHLFVLAGIAVWAMAVRLGPAVATPSARGADAVDYASAVARIYQRAGIRHRLAEQLARDFLDRLTAHLHLRRSALPAEILAAWRKRHPGETVPQLQELLRGAGELQRASTGSESISERLLLTWAQAFDLFTAPLQLKKSRTT